MANFFLVNPMAGISDQVDFAVIVEMIKGAAITSLASSDKFLELGLSEKFNLRIDPDNKGGVDVSLISTLNKDEIPPLTIRIVGEEEKPTAELVEMRIARLRRAYAIAYLVNAGREGELGELLDPDKRIPFVVVERLIKEDDKLYIEAASPGSLWLTLVMKTKGAYKAAANLFALFYPEGREALLRRVRANTVLRELEVEQKQLDLQINRANGILDMASKIDKIKDPATRESIKNNFLGNVRGLGNEARSLLSPPDGGTGTGKTAGS